MFSLSALFSVPQAVEGLSHSDSGKEKIGGSIALGLMINLLITIAISVCAIIASDEVTEVAIIGWSESLGIYVKIFASLFVAFAMVTSYWAISLALSDIVKEQMETEQTALLAHSHSAKPCDFIYQRYRFCRIR